MGGVLVAGGARTTGMSLRADAPGTAASRPPEPTWRTIGDAVAACAAEGTTAQVLTNAAWRNPRVIGGAKRATRAANASRPPVIAARHNAVVRVSHAAQPTATSQVVANARSSPRHSAGVPTRCGRIATNAANVPAEATSKAPAERVARPTECFCMTDCYQYI